MPKNKIALILMIAIIGIAAFYYYNFSPKSEGFRIEKNYKINYFGLVANKNVIITENEHVEEISLYTDANSLDFIVFTLIPKKLSSDVHSIEFSTNGKITIIEPNPLIKITPKSMPNSINLQMQFPTFGKDMCTVNSIFPLKWVDSQSKEEMQRVIDALLTLDADLNCDKANELENELGRSIFEAFSE